MTVAERLIATKGSYTALNKIADEYGWNMTQTLQRYHDAKACK